MIHIAVCALPAQAAVEARVGKLEAPEDKPLFEPRLVAGKTGILVVVREAPVKTASSFLPQTYEAPVHIGLLDLATLRPVWQKCDVKLKQVPRDNVRWSVTASRAGDSVDVIFCQLWSVGTLPAYMQIGRKGQNSPYTAQRYTPRVGVGQELSSGQFQSFSAAPSPSGILATAGDNRGRLWITRTTKADEWTKWRVLGVGSYPQLVNHDGVSAALFSLNQEHIVLANIMNARLQNAGSRSVAPASVPFCVTASRKDGACLVHLAGAIPHIVVSAPGLEKWSDNHIIKLETNIDRPAHIAATLSSGRVVFVIGTEAGELYAGRIPAKKIAEIPRLHGATSASAGGAVQHIDYGSVLGEDSPAALQARNKAIISLLTTKDASAVPLLLKHLDKKHDLVLRQNAIRALGAIGDARALPELFRLLDAPLGGNIADEGENEAILRRYTVLALQDIGHASAIPILRKIAESPKEYQSVRDLAKNAVEELQARK